MTFGTVSNKLVLNWIGSVRSTYCSFGTLFDKLIPKYMFKNIANYLLEPCQINRHQNLGTNLSIRKVNDTIPIVARKLLEKISTLLARVKNKYLTP